MPLARSTARRTLRRNLAINRRHEIYQISPERCFAKDANLSPAPALRPPAGGAAEEGRGPPVATASIVAHARARAQVRKSGGEAGLAAYLGRWLTPESLAAGAMAGHLFETFAVGEVVKSFANAGLDWRHHLSYYRGRDRRKLSRGGNEREVEGEIDLVIERDGVLHPVEIKLGAHPSADQAAAFPVLDAVPGRSRGAGAILCTCPQPGVLRENLLALPVWYV